MKLINADDLLEHAEVNGESEEFVNKLSDYIKDAPTIAPARKKGRWIPWEDEDGERYGDKCSECGARYVMPEGKTNYCPDCGAEMEE